MLHQFQLRVEHTELLAGAGWMVTYEVLLAVVRHQLRTGLEVLGVRRSPSFYRILLRRTEDTVLVRVLLVADEFLLVEDSLLAELANGMWIRSVVETGILNSVVQVTVVLLDPNSASKAVPLPYSISFRTEISSVPLDISRRESACALSKRGSPSPS